MEYSLKHRHIFGEIFKQVDVETLSKLARSCKEIRNVTRERLNREKESYIQSKIGKIISSFDGIVRLTVDPHDIDKIEFIEEDFGINQIISQYKNIHASSYIDLDNACFPVGHYDINLIQYLDVNSVYQYTVIDGYAVSETAFRTFLRKLIEKNIIRLEFISVDNSDKEDD